MIRSRMRMTSVRLTSNSVTRYQMRCTCCVVLKEAMTFVTSSLTTRLSCVTMGSHRVIRYVDPC